MRALSPLSLAAMAMAGAFGFATPAMAGCPGHVSADSGTLQTAMNDTVKPAQPAPATTSSDRK